MENWTASLFYFVILLGAIFSFTQNKHSKLRDKEITQAFVHIHIYSLSLSALSKQQNELQMNNGILFSFPTERTANDS